MTRKTWSLVVLTALAVALGVGSLKLLAQKNSVADQMNGQWVLCSGPRLAYSFSYPSMFRIWQYTPGSYSVTTCGQIEDLGQVVLATDMDTNPLQNRLDFYWIEGTQLPKAPKSLDDFLAEFPDTLKENRLLKRGLLGGEHAVWLQSPDGNVEVLAVYKLNVIQIDEYKMDESLFGQILGTFQFN
jgi:hypothetical protein